MPAVERLEMGLPNLLAGRLGKGRHAEMTMVSVLMMVSIAIAKKALIMAATRS